MHGESSGRFPISLDLQMSECELLRTSETTLIILEGFQISLSAWILLVLQMKNVLVSPRTIQPAYPSSCLGATLRWDSLIHSTDTTAAVGTHVLLYKRYKQDIWDWTWHQVMLSRFDASSNFCGLCWEDNLGESWWHLQKWGFVQSIRSFNAFLAFFIPSCSVYSILTAATFSLCSSLDSSHLFQAVCPKQDINPTKSDPMMNFWTVLCLIRVEIRSREFMHPYYIERWGLSSLFIIPKTFKFLEIILLIRKKICSNWNSHLNTPKYYNISQVCALKNAGKHELWAGTVSKMRLLFSKTGWRPRGNGV